MADDPLDVPAHDSERVAPEPKKSVFAAGARAARAANHSKTATNLVRVARESLPGGPKKDLFHPDAESTERLSSLIDRIVGDEPTVTRELGNLATATWQALISRRDRDYLPPQPITILFTDLVSFSTWALHRDDDDIVAEISSFRVVDEAALRALPQDVVLEFHAKGWLHLVILHLASQLSWQSVIAAAAPQVLS